MTGRAGQQQGSRRKCCQHGIDNKGVGVRLGKLENQPGRHGAYGLPQRSEWLRNAANGAQGLTPEEIGVGNSGHHQDAGHGNPEQARRRKPQQYVVGDYEQTQRQRHYQSHHGVGVRNAQILNHPAP